MDLRSLTYTIDQLITQVVEQVTDDSTDHTFGITFTFNTNQLEKYSKGVKEAYERESFVGLFKKLEKMKNHCLYWFEVEDKEHCDLLIELLNNYRAKKFT